MEKNTPQATPRPAAKRAPKTAAPAPEKATARKAAAQAAKAAKAAKPRKPKLVRDSFTIPKDEYGTLAELKQRCAKLDHASKKSELLRAGIKALGGMSDKSLLAALKAIPSIKTGRPKKA
jgi:hypothetical protein